MHSDSAPFMSTKTFVKWFFSWVASFRIDFRSQIDPVCGHDPPLLAFDGTHIGVSYKLSRMSELTSITAEDHNAPVITPRHKRYFHLGVQF